MAGREDRKKSSKGRKRRNKVRNQWRRPASPLTVGREVFRLKVPRSKTYKGGNIDRVTTGFNWTWEGASLTGSLSAQAQPDEKLEIQDGERIKAEVSPDGGRRWKRLWTMRVQSTSRSLGAESYELELSDETDRLRGSKDDFIYKKKGRGRKNGWLCHQIARDVARRARIPVGKLAKGNHKIKNLQKRNTDPISVIIEAYKQEREATGRRFVIDLHEGKLNVYPLRQSPYMLLVGQMLLAGTVDSAEPGNVVTAVTVRGVKKQEESGNKKRDKVLAKVQSTKLVKRYGYIHKSIETDAESNAEARREGMRYIAKKAKKKPKFTLRMPGMSSLRRGHAIKLRMPEHGIEQRIVFVKSVTHTVGAGSFESEVTVRLTDPYTSAKKERQRVQRCQKAKQRNRTVPKGCQNTKSKNRPKPSKAQKRTNRRRAAA